MNSELNFYVFRDGRRSVPGDRVLLEMRASLSGAGDESGWIDALLRCGELECALEDAGCGEAATLAAISDKCAAAVVNGRFQSKPELLRGLPERVPGELQVSTPECFAYYALHPLHYADVIEQFGDVRDAVVIGIRSIGTTLSAVTAAALRGQGARVERFTVRPEGHPFDREVRWTSLQSRVVREGTERGAVFVVVDEGPGLSGSSFLSVAEALGSAGVREEQIVIVPSHAPDTSVLRAPDAARRWAKFRCVPIARGRHPQGEWIGAGEWRCKFLNEGDWPGTWTTMERAKFLSADERVFWKFEGLGPYGARAGEQARALAVAGFGAPVVGDENGFLGYECQRGHSVRRDELDLGLLKRIAAYCAFRAEQFACEVSAAQREDLTTMLRVNFEREFGAQVPESFASLEVVRPTICDAKMAPHEWFRSEEGRLRKLDATSHGDDHFFPGPCDVAWDLAGALVEWEMEPPACDALLREYESLTGDDATTRLESYRLAYAVFRFAWSRMASAGMKGRPDEERLLRDYQRYRSCVERMVAASAHR
jgi:hypothetical protein